MLNLDQVRSLITGAVQVYEQDGYFRFSRFRQAHYDAMLKRLEEYYKENPYQGGFDDRAMCTSGIRFSFTTQGGEFSFEYLIPKDNRCGYYGMDIQIDGVGVYHRNGRNIPDLGIVKLAIPATEKPCEVTLYFPNTAHFALRNICLPADFAPAPERKFKYLAIGDSISQGHGSDHSDHSYPHLLADMLGAELLNQAIGGVQFDAVFVDAEVPYQPDLVTVSYGPNDWGANAIYNNEKPRQLMEKVVASFPNSQIFLIVPIWVSDEATSLRGGYSVEDIRREIERVAAQFPQITVIDGRNFVPHIMEYFCDRRMHPNDAGYLHYAYHLYNAIKPQLHIAK